MHLHGTITVHYVRFIGIYGNNDKYSKNDSKINFEQRSYQVTVQNTYL